VLFNSFQFLVFFAVFMCVFFGVPQRHRGVVLLLSSYVFYMGWRPSFALLLLFTTVTDYTSGLVIGGSERPVVRRTAMAAALTINLGILAALKYLDFAIVNFINLAGVFGFAIPHTDLGIVLPVGISFYTFQSVGYTLDVYARQIPAERSLLAYAQYVSFFPQLVAGPIERAGHMLPQYRRPHFLRPERIVSGGWLVGYGLFQKMCIADMVAPFVNTVFADPAQFNGTYSAAAIVLFSVQIYCDFSGYSTIARGLARIMGYELMINFAQPYCATSLTEFWRRWHISLSTWFRDYLYLPLGGNRVGSGRGAFNLMTVFVASGIWHGAAWTFVFWGGLHGSALVIERAAKDRFAVLGALAAGFPRGAALAGWTWTMAVVLAGWAFFRSASLNGAVRILSNLAHPGPIKYGTFKVAGFASLEIALTLVFVPAMVAADYCIRWRPDVLAAVAARPWAAASCGALLFYTIAMFGVFGHVDFIYFQF
jgi:alginate O-acetyltransferase complex protein AlgI